MVEADAQWAGPILEAIRALEQPLALAFNRDRVMVLPPAIGKSTGLRQALSALRLSVHNAVAIGDAENDHDLLEACEVGAAVGWGSAALRAVADEVIDGPGPSAVAHYIRQVAQQPRLAATQMRPRNLTLGRQDNGDEVRLAVRGRTILVAGAAGTGKSWMAGLLCEQSILQGYSVCIIDADGDYQSLEALPGVVTLGSDDPLPTARELLRAMRHPDISVIVELSEVPDQQKREYVGTLLPLLATWRRSTGLPHKILLDHADRFLTGSDVAQMIDPELAGYIFVTSHLSRLPDRVRATPDAVVFVTREHDPTDMTALLGMCRPHPCTGVSLEMFQDMQKGEVALLPGSDEAQGRVRHNPRLSPQPRIDKPLGWSPHHLFTDRVATSCSEKPRVANPQMWRPTFRFVDPGAIREWRQFRIVDSRSPHRPPIICRLENLLNRIACRASELVVVRIGHETGSNRVQHNVPRHPKNRFTFAKDVIVVARLPERAGVFSTPGKSGLGVPTLEQSRERAVMSFPLGHKVGMIRHETVRRKCKAMRRGTDQ